MPSAGAFHKAKLTVTISEDVVDRIDEIAKGSGAPRSQVMEEALRYWLHQKKKRKIENDIENYYLALSEEEKAEDSAWVKTAAGHAARTWDD